MNRDILKGISTKRLRACAQLVGVDARSPAEVALAEGVSANAIIRRRRKFEAMLGITLPRQHKVGRPIRINRKADAESLTC